MINNIGKLYSNLKVKYFDDSYGRSLKYKTGLKPKFFSVTENFDLLDHGSEDEETQKVQKFLCRYKNVYVIPLELPDDYIFGFIFKSRDTKNFYNYKIDKNFPMMFNFQSFKNFENKPIVLTEGLKDCLAVSLLYPFTLAYLTSQPSKKLFDFLNSITNRIIIFRDNDETGSDLLKMHKYKRCSIHTSTTKDFGVYWDEFDKILLDEIRAILSLEGL